MSAIRARIGLVLRFAGAALVCAPAAISFYWLWSM